MTFTQDRTGVGSGTAEWQTPPELFWRLNRAFDFTYDAAASRTNALVGFYSTAEGTFVQGRREPVSEADGLNYPWEDLRVFLNPPYTRGLIDQFVEKAYAEREQAALIVMLLPASTETRWFQQFVMPHCHIDWLSRRVRYIDPATGKPGGSPPGGSVIATFKHDWMASL